MTHPSHPDIAPDVRARTLFRAVTYDILQLLTILLPKPILNLGAPPPNGPRISGTFPGVAADFRFDTALIYNMYYEMYQNIITPYRNQGPEMDQKILPARFAFWLRLHGYENLDAFYDQQTLELELRFMENAGL